MSDRSHHVAALLVLCLFAAAYGVAFAYPRQLSRGFLINDEAWYAEPARNILEGRGYVTDTLYPMFARESEGFPVPERFKQIGFPWLGALAGSLFGLNDRVLVLLALVGMALAVPACFAALRRLLRDGRTAMWLTLVTLGSPVALSIWTAALPESWFCFLFWAGLALLHFRDTKAIALAGGLLMASVYFKGFAIVYLPICATYLIVRGQRPRAQLAALATGAVVVAAAGQLVLPTAASQLSESSSSYAGSMLLFETAVYPLLEGPFYDIDRVDAVSWILRNPGDYLFKVARMIGRTKRILEVLGGPAVGGILLPLLLLAASIGSWRLVRGLPGLGWLPASTRKDRPVADREVTARRVLLLTLIGANFAFFWATNFKERYFLHMLPLMLAVGAVELLPATKRVTVGQDTRRIAATILVGFFVIYPLAQGLERAYRDPHAYLGRLLASRFIEYPTVIDHIEEHVPRDAVVMTHLAHEISWYTRRKTILPPGDVSDIAYLVDKFDVRAVYHHPGVSPPQGWNNGDFKVVPGTRGLLWLRVEGR